MVVGRYQLVNNICEFICLLCRLLMGVLNFARIFFFTSLQFCNFFSWQKLQKLRHAKISRNKVQKLKIPVTFFFQILWGLSINLSDPLRIDQRTISSTLEEFETAQTLFPVQWKIKLLNSLGL